MQLLGHFPPSRMFPGQEVKALGEGDALLSTCQVRTRPRLAATHFALQLAASCHIIATDRPNTPVQYTMGPKLPQPLSATFGWLAAWSEEN